ncbi:hypothetical protein CC2G_000112 [Coprinopsis cinerea AmutBmut pab1-1]|nr:hypothetical protein CC2G_000112 [Coprinopsis cinerea AmutBmut pab1-1]
MTTGRLLEDHSCPPDGHSTSTPAPIVINYPGISPSARPQEVDTKGASRFPSACLESTTKTNTTSRRTKRSKRKNRKEKRKEEEQQEGEEEESWRPSTCTGNKKAVLVGINYFGEEGELRGCINDAVNLKNFLLERGFEEENIRVLTDDQEDDDSRPTKANIIENLKWLVEDPQPDDSLFFSFSGHGASVEDEEGDEHDGNDETICPCDHEENGFIKDDELHALLVPPLPIGCRLTVIFDVSTRYFVSLAKRALTRVVSVATLAPGLTFPSWQVSFPVIYHKILYPDSSAVCSTMITGTSSNTARKNISRTSHITSKRKTSMPS